jgi:hypothetical protein
MHGLAVTILRFAQADTTALAISENVPTPQVRYLTIATSAYHRASKSSGEPQ